jgi:alkanesulfonate monooxygenase SsuD/methylene tetrahydromethanopterin reductase-like flavin-dependent oxidoreductase (luciferase family)
MEFGVFHEFPWRYGEGQDEASAFEEAFDLVDACEAWGLDVLWLAELHFETRSVLASPLTIASAIAARTQRMRIGMAVQVLPLCDPLRLAEETATVDQISRGRLIFGVGRSGFQRVYKAYGVPYEESRDRFAETLQIVLKAWTQETFSHDGHYKQYHDVRLVPKPYQKPHPPIRIAATSPDTYPVIGAQGYPIFVGVRLGTFSDLTTDIRAYQTAYRENGHGDKGQVFLRVPVYVAESMEDAIREPEESIMIVFKRLAAQAAASTAGPLVGAAGERDNVRAHLAHVTYEEALADKVVVGTPDTVAARLGELRDQLGLDGILFEPNSGGMIPYERVKRTMRLLCEDVIPRLR